LYGWAHDLRVEANTNELASEARTAIAAIPGVTGVSFGTGGAPLVLDRVATEGILMRATDTEVGPVLLEGRRPRALDEIAVGRKTLGALHKQIGERVEMGVQGATVHRSMKIVGIVVLPLNSDSATLGEGGFATHEALHSLLPEVPINDAFIRVAPGARASVIAAVSKFGSVELPTRPGPVLDFGHVRSMPLALAGILALIATGTLAHLLATSIRRRQRDLAILKTLGFVRHQVRGAVAWQAGTIATVSLVIAVPAGIAVGRWMWVLFARYGGFVPAPVVSFIDVAVVVGATMILSQLVAVLPARAAARMQPAEILRAE